MSMIGLLVGYLFSLYCIIKPIIMGIIGRNEHLLRMSFSHEKDKNWGLTF